VWVPLTAGSRGLPTAHLLKSRESLWLLMGARMKPGATLERVRSESAGVMASLQRTYPDVYHDHGFAVQPLRRLQAGFAGVAPFFAFLLALVGIVLIAACANLAGVLLARGSNRAKEFALRRALGASRGSLLTLCGIECLILFLPGFALAFIVARVTLTSVGRLTNGLPVPVNAQVSIDWSTVAVTTAVTVGLAVVTALLPAWQTTGGSLVGDLKQDAAAPRRQRLRRLVVATQVAFCLATIAIGGVLFRAAHLAAAADPGFSVANVDIATVNFELGAYQSKQANGATEALRERIAAIPGVARVGAASLIPLEGSRMGFGDLRRPGTTGADASIDAGQSVISPDYLPALGISITRGRNFTQADRAETTLHVIVNERFAKVVWPNQDPIGQRLEFGDFRPDHADTISTVTVVGIARDVTYKTVGEGPTSFVYFPLGELEYMKPHYFIVRQPGFSSEALAPALRQTLARFDRTLPLVDFVPFARYAEITSMPQRIAASIAGSLGALALALAAMGLYGLTAFTVASRTREIGVRVALGASRVGILRMVIWQAARTATIGAGAGLVLALVTARLLSTVLYGVPPVDALAVGVATMVVGGVGLVATYLPARRAATVDPMTALRVD
jgi:predicted permease